MFYSCERYSNMKTFIFLTILLQFFVLQVQTNECELTSNDEIQLTANEFIQSRQLCNTLNFPPTNIRGISITGRLVDYTTRCQSQLLSLQQLISH
jgi:hypothetical protein